MDQLPTHSLFSSRRNSISDPLPTTFLPRLPRSLSSLSTSSHLLLNLVLTLKTLYGTPRLSGAMAREKTGEERLESALGRVKRAQDLQAAAVYRDSGYASSTPPSEEDDGFSTDEDDEGLEDEGEQIGKEDVFERTYAKEWLLAILKRGEAWIEDAEDVEEREIRGEVVERASELIASLSVTSASGAILRPLLLPTCTVSPRSSTISPPLSITLHDALPSSLDPTSVGLQSWGSSIILGRMIALDPASFGIHHGPGGAGRVLEMGAGTGLLSLVWRGMWDRFHPESKEEEKPAIVATDFHAGVIENLHRNIDDNTHPTSSPITVSKLDWSAVHTSLRFASRSCHSSLSMPAPFDSTFDLILAADVVYGPEHAAWIRSCIEQFLRRPSDTDSPDAANPAFHLIVPLRPTHIPAISSIPLSFPEASSFAPREEGEDWRIGVKAMSETGRVRGIGRVDEGGYRLFEIGWC